VAKQFFRFAPATLIIDMYLDNLQMTN